MHEFVGLIRDPPYRVLQGIQGNYTRFINHSRKPSCLLQPFGTEGVIVISKGVVARAELTVAYSERHWRRLGKQCLCRHTNRDSAGIAI
jgi:SET domain-containing protein